MSVAPTWLGIDVGASKMLCVRIDDAGLVVAEERVATSRDDGAEAVYVRLVALTRRLKLGSTRGVGVGFAGLVDVEAGRVRSSIMLPGFEGFPLAERLARDLELPATLDNDATAAGVGEYAARGRPPGLHMALLTVGTGIGGALVLDGRPFRGRGGLAGEIGNMTVAHDGPRCWCGADGCLNMLASGSAIEAAYAAATGRALKVPEIAARAAAGDGDGDAGRSLSRAADALGAGVANLVNLLNPDLVVLAGGVASLGEPFMEQVRASAGRRAFREALDRCRIETALAGEAAGALGAALLARDRTEAAA